MTHPTGFEKLAAWTASIPDYEGFVFRRFDRLSARNLQHLESELTFLETKLDGLDQEAAASSDVNSLRTRYNWETFEELSKVQNSLTAERMEASKNISHEMLVLQSKIAAMEQPDKLQLAVVRKHFNHGIHPTEFLPNGRRNLEGQDYFRLDKDRELVALNPTSDKDLLSRFLRRHPGMLKVRLTLYQAPYRSWRYVKLANRTQSETLSTGEEYFDEKYISFAVSIVSIALAAILLLGAIISLRLVQDEKARIGMIVGFTVLFTASVSFLTNAKRADIFASGAAYTAVLVVFVSGDLGGSSEC
ncbi:unnamed protein product [Fusarium fujikuroi]|uniref:DUF6594 domain-containing protein n=1 Tax=Fusarium fujikuroi TaxID=5127 RepID=A0A9Q9U7R0_FUSFU|nr:unnamed protein product [Fusarium fujikuroi]VZH97765.1 unnamed protein product [Fusarium fujikuroi]